MDTVLIVTFSSDDIGLDASKNKPGEEVGSVVPGTDPRLQASKTEDAGPIHACRYAQSAANQHRLFHPLLPRSPRRPHGLVFLDSEVRVY